MRDGNEDRPLNREVEAAAAQEVGENVGDPEALPQPAEEERAADARAGETPGPHLGKDYRPLAVAGKRGDQPVQCAAGQQHILAPQRPDDLLPDPSTARTLSTRYRWRWPRAVFSRTNIPKVVRRDKDKSNTKQLRYLEMSHYTFRHAIDRHRKFTDLHRVIANPFATHCSSWA